MVKGRLPAAFAKLDPDFLWRQVRLPVSENLSSSAFPRRELRHWNFIRLGETSCFVFYCCNNSLIKSNLGRKGFVWLLRPSYSPSLGDARARADTDPGGVLLPGSLPWLSQPANLPSGGPTHSGRGSPTRIINLENAIQTFPQVMEAISPMRFPPPR